MVFLVSEVLIIDSHGLVQITVQLQFATGLDTIIQI